MKRRDLERHLRENGCHEVGGAKHAKWRGPQGEVSALPRHREIGPGAGCSLLQVYTHTGLTPTESSVSSLLCLRRTERLCDASRAAGTSGIPVNLDAHMLLYAHVFSDSSNAAAAR